ncbi:uncharacterized protein PITG_06704 [Phytophthora infestans T30-4]|uniref:Uncharacterized protein n=1 Tax=Phytophthora infestans (strain T30-4) TaxID=403677 RepID=D0N7W4_PHYIT|nr:uncharacterized protein PITG_06704 [Phytophthora infestans T30-4]EEY53081.1 hypothetical protein PITG_06704 [Phytophthora infestans T30-4]|eukprot:XP_002904699.1 hypothetical protein PITG_06704 [Phytophthora infestans T30-4]
MRKRSFLLTLRVCTSGSQEMYGFRDTSPIDRDTANWPFTRGTSIIFLKGHILYMNLGLPVTKAPLAFRRSRSSLRLGFWSSDIAMASPWRVTTTARESPTLPTCRRPSRTMATSSVEPSSVANERFDVAEVGV